MTSFPHYGFIGRYNNFPKSKEPFSVNRELYDMDYYTVQDVNVTFLSPFPSKIPSPCSSTYPAFNKFIKEFKRYYRENEWSVDLLNCYEEDDTIRTMSGGIPIDVISFNGYLLITEDELKNLEDVEIHLLD